MAMLAEPKRRQKYSTDPRGLQWANDNDKFGQKMLETMGWKKGKGLGANLDGKAEHIQVDVKNNTRGVGCDKSYADKWISHQDDFNSLLSQLNTDHHDGSQSDSETRDRVMSLENKSKTSRSRVHYQKFTKGKDLSSRNKEDLACVFGKRKSKSESNTPLVQSEVNSDAEETKSDPEETEPRVDKSHGFTTITSSSSVAEYFAMKMAQLQKGRAGQSTSEELETATDRASSAEQSPGGGDESKDGITFSAEPASGVTAEDEPKEIVDTSERKSKKKKKKKSKRSHDEIDGGDSEEVSAKKHKHNCEEPADATEGADEARKSKKKKKKSKEKKSEELSTEVDVDSVENDSECGSEVKKKKKKSKKRAQEECESNQPENVEVTEKPKKKKKKCKDGEEKDRESIKSENVDVTENPKSKKKKKKCKDGEETVTVESNREANDNRKQEADENVEKHSRVSKKKKKKNNDSDSDLSKDQGFKGANLVDIKGYAAHC